MVNILYLGNDMSVPIWVYQTSANQSKNIFLSNGLIKSYLYEHWVDILLYTHLINKIVANKAPVNAE